MKLRPPESDAHSARPTCASGARSCARITHIKHARLSLRTAYFIRCVFPLIRVQNTMPFLQHCLDSQLEKLALEQVVPALQDRGFFYVDRFLGDIAGHMVLGQVKRMHYCGLLSDGQLAARSNGVCRRNIRGDKITWVNGNERGTEAVNFLLTLIDKLISLCVGRLGKSIRARSKVSLKYFKVFESRIIKACIHIPGVNWNISVNGGKVHAYCKNVA